MSDLQNLSNALTRRFTQADLGERIELEQESDIEFAIRTVGDYRE